MKLTLTVGSNLNRKLILEFNRYTHYYAKTFDLRRTDVKGGAIRFGQGEDRGTVHIRGASGSHWLEISLNYQSPKPPTTAFHGAMIAFLGSFATYAGLRFREAFELSVDQSEVPDLSVMRTWGDWAYGKTARLNDLPELPEPTNKEPS